MSERTKLQQMVIEEAYKRLCDRSWFRGVCLDQLSTDDEIEQYGFETAVDHLVFDTIYWDGDK